VSEEGLAAVTDRDTLERAIDDEALDTPIDMDAVRSSATEESENAVDLSDETDTTAGAGSFDETDESG
jgi:hypothetical protein